MPRSFGPYKNKPRGGSFLKTVVPVVASTFVLAIGLFSLPTILSFDLAMEQSQPQSPFPVSVDPAKKLIVDNPEADALIQSDATPRLTADVFDATDSIIASIASFIASLPFYQEIAGADNVFVTIQPGFREEQVAASFGNALGWTTKTRQAFLTSLKTTPPTLSEGEFVAGTYEISATAQPIDVQNMLNDRFTSTILNRYSTTTASQVPLSEALTIASLIQRESGGPNDMQYISGIIWNRLFANMNLQIDATLQYAKASNTSTPSWWPGVVPNDRYIKSAYNTYEHSGLPPTPIASPSVAAVIAALNPKPTNCIFYFHDANGNFHCSVTYAQHVALLKKYYGQGK